MATGNQANGQADNRIGEQLSSGAVASKSDQPRVSAATRFKKSTRLCLVVPLHLVKRLEAHAAGEGKTRDQLATDLIDWAMGYSYRKRDKLLREACGLSDSDGEPE
jgi:hypothetical protein